MTTIDTRPDATGAGFDDTVGGFFAGAGAWLTSTDHKRVGRLYLGASLLALVVTAVLGVVLGVERSDGGQFVLDDGALLQLFQAHRVALVFAVIAPLGLGLSLAIVPLQLGARSLAFARLALTGFYAWLGGLALTMAALGRNGGIGGGDPDMVDLFLAGHGLMIIGLLASAGCVATSVLTTRAPGMTMRRVPLFSWSALIGALAMLLVLPVVFGAVVLLFVDHRYTSLNFGGADGIGTWIGWMFSVPAVIIFALPAVGVAAELIPVTFRHRQPLRGVAFAGIALVGVSALAAVTQQFVHDVSLDSDQATRSFVDDAVPFLVFNGLPLLGLVVVMGLGALTVQGGMKHGRPGISAPFVFSFLGLGMVFVGVLGSAVQAIDNFGLQGTVFDEGAVIYVVYGTALAVMGGIVFWAPKLWGRVIPDKQVLPLALAGVAATVLASLPYYIAGFLDQPAGAPVYDDGDLEIWNILVLVGHALMALTVVAFVGLMLKIFVARSGDGADEAADENPYDGHTIEWSASSPAPHDNFPHVPTVASPEPVFDLTYEGSRS